MFFSFCGWRDHESKKLSCFRFVVVGETRENKRLSMFSIVVV